MTVGVEVVHGDALEVLAGMDAASVDAVVTDPPYLIGFMGREWDRVEREAAQDWHRAWAEQCLRVLKPGGHLLAMGGSRTYHRLACGIEDAGFEIRDCIAWMYGQGFPKSRDVSKAIDKAAGAEREMRVNERWSEKYPNGPGGNLSGEGRSAHYHQAKRITNGPLLTSDPVTEDAQRWQGWGTALKPAFEPVVVARKPLAGTVAANVVEHGTGALHVDACRIGRANGDRTDYGLADGAHAGIGYHGLDGRTPYDGSRGRWPANVVLDEEAARLLDQQSGWSPPSARTGRNEYRAGIYGPNRRPGDEWGYVDSGGASRFFYTAKASRAERNAGLDGMPRKMLRWSSGDQSPGTFQADGTDRHAENHHPTVKPVGLMRWLLRLVTPPGGLIVDLFAGSGTTGVAAALEGLNAVLIERDADSAEIARRRVAWASLHPADFDTDPDTATVEADRPAAQQSLFGAQP